MKHLDRSHLDDGSLRSNWLVLGAVATLLLALSMFFWRTAVVHANTLAVTNANNSGAGSLRETISSASPGDTIVFSLTLPATITLSSELVMTKSLTISGPSASLLTISGNHATRVISVSSGTTLNLSNMTMAYGAGADCGGFSCGGAAYSAGTLNITNTTFYSNSTFTGGSIRNIGILNVTNSTFLTNSATNNGGGISNGGTLNVSGSTFSGNNATHNGGGINNSGGTLNITTTSFFSNSAGAPGGGINNVDLGGGATATVINSTFAGNRAPDGGGIADFGTVNVINSTISGNSADDAGGGIYNQGTLNVTNSTLSGNGALTTGGGGIENFSGTTTLKNTIIANSTSGGDCQNFGTLTADSHNLADDNTCSNATQKTSAQINLAPLGNNGGATDTMELLPGSAAIDAGDDAVCAGPPVNNLDQRGWHRPFGSKCDIGAYERGAFIYLPNVVR